MFSERVARKALLEPMDVVAYLPQNSPMPVKPESYENGQWTFKFGIRRALSMPYFNTYFHKQKLGEKIIECTYLTKGDTLFVRYTIRT